MIEILRKIWRFAGEEQKNIRTSIIGCFFFAVFHMFQMAAIYVVILALVDGSASSAPAWQALGLLLVSIIGRAIVNRFTQLQQTHAGYFMVANKRIAIGDKLKRVPMGYFNDKSLGELTGITTTVLDDVENTGPMVLVNILSGLSIPWSCSCLCWYGIGAWACWPLRAWRFIFCCSRPWNGNPPSSLPSGRRRRPRWWRRCWSSCKA